MQAYTAPTDAPATSRTPTEELKVAISFPSPAGQPGLTKFEAPLSVQSVRHFTPEPIQMDRGIRELSKRGFTLTERGQLSASLRCSRATFERVFGTRLRVFTLEPGQHRQTESFYFPSDGAPWQPDPEVMKFIDDAYIQWPHIYMAQATSVKRKRALDAGPAAVPMALPRVSPP